MTDREIMILPESALPKVHRVKKRGHAGQPGEGPEGEMCATCKYYRRKYMAKVYRKCGLLESKWTGGPGTDIRARDPACEFWERPDDG